MSVTTNIHTALSQEKALAPSAMAMHGAQSQQFGNFDDPGQVSRAPKLPVMRHPLADQLQGRAVLDQIKYVLVDRCQFLGKHLGSRVMEDRCTRVSTAYAELQAMGFKFSDVTTFGLRHAKALLASWQAKGLARKTIYNRWSSLRSWSMALNKHGMLGPLEQWWPAYKQPQADQNLARELSTAQLQARSDWLRGKSDQTAYLVDRLTREAGLSRDDPHRSDTGR